VASVLSHMIGGRQPLVTEILAIVRRIQRLTRGDPMRVTEEQALLEVLLRERRCSGVPLGDGAFALLVAPGGPLAPPPQRGPTGLPCDPRRRPPPSSSSDPQPGPSGAQGGPGRPSHPSLSPKGLRGDVHVQDLHRGSQGPGVDHLVPHLASSTSRLTQMKQRRTWTRLQ